MSAAKAPMAGIPKYTNEVVVFLFQTLGSEPREVLCPAISTNLLTP